MQDLKKFSIRVMIGSLISAAVLAVMVVLVGEFNEVFGRALGTIALVTVHALACLSYSEYMERVKQGSGLVFFQNTLFALIVLSFLTSIFGTWQLLDGEVVGKLYLSYMVFAFASLHGSALAATTGKTNLIDNIVWANYAFMAVVVFMLMPIIWMADSVEFSGFYYRLLAACGIIDATLTILAIIYHVLYIQKHPETKSVLFTIQSNGKASEAQQGQVIPARKTNPLVWLLGIFIVGQIAISIISMIVGAVFRSSR